MNRYSFVSDEIVSNSFTVGTVPAVEESIVVNVSSAWILLVKSEVTNIKGIKVLMILFVSSSLAFFIFNSGCFVLIFRIAFSTACFFFSPKSNKTCCLD